MRFAKPPHMNKYLSAPLICIFFFACNDNTNTVSVKNRLPRRDTSINKSNAYNDLFLDSSTLENFIAKNDSDNTSSILREFYYARNFEFAWFSSNGLTEQARGFWNLYTYHIMAEKDTSLNSKTLKKSMKLLTADDSLVVNGKEKNIVQTELLLTEYFIRYEQKNDKKSAENITQWNFILPSKKENLTTLTTNLLKLKNKNQWFSKSQGLYGSLEEELEHYYKIVKAGGWDSIPYIHKALKHGKTAEVIPLIKKRLQVTAELADKDSSGLFDDNLQTAVKLFQTKLGYTATGKINDSLIKDLNVSAQTRLAQLVININRMKWMPEKPSGRLIVVNIPEYRLHVYDGDTKTFDMDVVVGKEGKSTVIFTGNLNEIVFSPYWNIPPSIVQTEILPKMQEDPSYLAEENIEITKEENGLPVMRQLPGPKNSLGKVKFLFPNSFNIYFHDTPAKDLFNKDKRAYSHGCIRLSDPVKMAQYLLQDQPNWTPEKIDSAMNTKEPKSVTVKSPVPVMINYFTAWIDETGQLNFRDDIYGHDSTEADKLFTTKF
jgi:murein L,D-transpeptidase YcbB/YkuD